MLRWSGDLEAIGLGGDERNVRRWLQGGLLVAWAALIGLVATSPGKSVFDEPYLTMYLSLFHERGLSWGFLASRRSRRSLNQGRRAIRVGARWP